MSLTRRARNFVHAHRLVPRLKRDLRAAGIDGIRHVDLGSAGGMEYRWRVAVQDGVIHPFLVDPAEDWGPSRLSVGHLPNVTHVRYAFGDADRTTDFFETKHPGCSSCLKPSAAALARYPVAKWFEVVATSQMPLRRADSVWAEHGYPAPDTIKIDVQGFEVACLEGFGALLDQVSCIEAEARLRAIYEGEPTLYDMHGFMESKGFMLRHLAGHGPFEGEYLEVNSFWVRRPAERDSRRAAITAAWEELCLIPPPGRFRG